MSRRAWAYIWSVLLAGAVLSGLALPGLAQSTSQWLTFATLVILAIFAHLFKARGAGHEAWHANLVFLFAGVLLLHPSLFVLLVIIPHLVEWARERLVNSPSLRNWYIQPFNIAGHIIAGSAAGWVHTALNGDTAVFLTPSSVFAVTVAALTYVVLNHVLVAQALVLARGVSWRESGILDIENLLTDLILLVMGAVVAVLWQLNPWLIIPALSPLVLIQRALMVPKLKKEARSDSKTGLWNAGHFIELFTTEMQRAKRFNRPLAFIMTDLDLLRNINNTYGHLAGDAVLVGVARIIRETIREYDIAGRFGGEEFTIVLPEVDLLEAHSLAERLRKAVEAASFEVKASPTPIKATMSLGVACFPEDATTPTNLIHEADVAVYQAKLKGRNRVVCASDVPHSIRLEGAAAEDRLATPYAAAFASRPKIADEDVKPDADAPATPLEGEKQADSATVVRRYSTALLWLFVGAVIAAGVVLTVLGLVLSAQSDLTAIGLFSALAVITQLLQTKNLYGKSSVSVSVAVNFAAALFTGFPGVACVSAAIVLAHYFQRRPAPYKTAFNWATHVLASSAPMLAMGVLAIPLHLSNLLLLAIPSAVSALVFYAIETGLIATAISLSEGTSLMATWRDRYRWLAGHYLVLCIMGLFVAVAYRALGTLGVTVFTLPVLMMAFVQRQYVERTEDGVQELQRMYEELASANSEVVEASRAIRQLNEELFLVLAKIIDSRDPYVAGHSAKVTEYATTIATELGLSAERVKHVRQAAFLHDIGKIGISEQVLHKPGTLTDEEYEHVKTHAALGAEFLDTCQGLRHLAPFVKHHHEWWDGNGYPGGLPREQPPLEARILAVCDAVEAMASDRPYHRAMSLSEIAAEVKNCAGTQFDPAVTEAFIRIAEREGDRFVTNSAREVRQKQADNGDLESYSNGWFTFQRSAWVMRPAV
ncbi:MAG: diguanylate cyclase [Anaerolineales bacterium]|nr:diguanylate cyclase [Anaerolineales bacterium]